MSSPELPGPENALEPLLKPEPGALGVVGELGTTMAPLVEPPAPAPGIDGAPDGVANHPAPLAPKPPPAFEVLPEEVPPEPVLKPLSPGVPME